MAEDIIYLDERKSKRLFVKCPLDYEIGGIDLKGVTVNACSEGIMVESSLPLRTAFQIFMILDENPNYQTELEFALEGKTHVIEAEIRHFHLDFSGTKPYFFRVGFRFPRGRIDVHQNG